MPTEVVVNAAMGPAGISIDQQFLGLGILLDPHAQSRVDDVGVQPFLVDLETRVDVVLDPGGIAGCARQVFREKEELPEAAPAFREGDAPVGFRGEKGPIRLEAHETAFEVDDGQHRCRRCLTLFVAAAKRQASLGLASYTLRGLPKAQSEAASRAASFWTGIDKKEGILGRAIDRSVPQLSGSGIDIQDGAPGREDPGRWQNGRVCHVPSRTSSRRRMKKSRLFLRR